MLEFLFYEVIMSIIVKLANIDKLKVLKKVLPKNKEDTVFVFFSSAILVK